MYLESTVSLFPLFLWGDLCRRLSAPVPLVSFKSNTSFSSERRSTKRARADDGASLLLFLQRKTRCVAQMGSSGQRLAGRREVDQSTQPGPGRLPIKMHTHNAQHGGMPVLV